MMLGRVLCIAALAVASANMYFEETFSDKSWENRWVKSTWKEGMGKWSWTSGEWHADAASSKGIQTTTDMANHAISAKLPEVINNDGKDLVVQFTVKHEKKEYSFCGGGYIKLLPSGMDQKNFGGDSPYHIMFGPDLCGYDVSRIHLIFTHKGKNLLKIEEIKLDYNDKDEYTHLYTLILHPDNTFEVYFDQKEKAKGNVLDGWSFPSKSTDDPSDKKPSDWVDSKKIIDPEDKKPEGWDDIPATIPDPEASKPEEWDDEDDGEWEPAMVSNPKYKGEWKAKEIDNPKYKGEWKAKQLDNPEFDPNPVTFMDIEYVGFEVWTVNNGTIFDNVVLASDYSLAKASADKHWNNPIEKEKKEKEKWKKVNEPVAESNNAEDDEEDEKDEL